MAKNHDTSMLSHHAERLQLQNQAVSLTQRHPVNTQKNTCGLLPLTQSLSIKEQALNDSVHPPMTKWNPKQMVSAKKNPHTDEEDVLDFSAEVMMDLGDANIPLMRNQSLQDTLNN